MLHNAFHFHESRTFYQDRGIGNGNLLHRCADGFDRLEMARRCSHCCTRCNCAIECLYGETRGVAEAEEMIDALRSGISTNLFMKLLSFVTNLAHIAQHQHARCSGSDQYIDGSA